MFKAPTSKLQLPNTFQIPISESQIASDHYWRLALGAWSLQLFPSYLDPSLVHKLRGASQLHVGELAAGVLEIYFQDVAALNGHFHRGLEPMHARRNQRRGCDARAAGERFAF